MVLFSSDIKKSFKVAMKNMKHKFIFPLSLVTLFNISSAFAAKNDTITEVNESSISEIKDNDNSSSSITEVSNNEIDNLYAVSSDKNVNHVDKYAEVLKSTEKVSKESNVSDKPIKEQNTEIDAVTKELDVDKINAYTSLDNYNLPKKELINAIIDGSIKEIGNPNFLYGSTSDSNNLIITAENMHLFSREEKIAYVCEKYGLKDYEFKAIATTVFNETFANNYDDAYRVTNTIYNRTKSKRWVDTINNVTNLDGTSMYAQVIAPSQFDGYLPTYEADYEILLTMEIYDGTIPFETTLDAILDFLISEKIVHNFLSFKGLGYEIPEYERMQEGFGTTNWVKYTSLGNTYHNSLTENDLIDDEEYTFIFSEESAKVLSRRKN